MIFLKFATEVKGDADTKGYEKQITVDSAQLGVGRAISSSGSSMDRDTSAPSFSEMTFTKSADISSAELWAQATHGKSLGTATVSFVNIHDGQPQLYLKYELHDAIVSSYSLSSGGDRPSESFSVNFAKIEMKYQQFDGAKNIADLEKKWDLRKGETF